MTPSRSGRQVTVRLTEDEALALAMVANAAIASAEGDDADVLGSAFVKLQEARSR